MIARGGKVAACARFPGVSVIRRQFLAHFGTEIAAAEDGSAWTANRHAARRRSTRAPLRRGEVGLSHLFDFLAPLFLFAVMRIEHPLAQPDRLGGHLDQLVVLDIGQRLFQRHADRGR